MDWIDSPSSLFGYLQSRAGIVEWKGGPGFATKEETYCELQRQSPSFVTVEPLPHWPPIKDHYYTCPIPAPGDGRALTQLVDFHCLETEVDRELTFALYATGIWGGPPGTRPAFLVTAATGRGKGKTRYCQNFARTFGGYLDVSPQEDIGSIKTRFLSPAAAAKRIATLDNLKTPRFSWAEFENFITADTISGKRMYEGDGNRPNFITWTITLNGASLSTDMAQRVVEIRLREPTYTDTWEEQVAAYIDANREKIIADCVGFLQRPAKTMKRHSRWATWEAQVLSKVEHPDDCLSLILDRRGAVDVEQEESEIIEDYFAPQVEMAGLRPRARRRFHTQRHGRTLVQRGHRRATEGHRSYPRLETATGRRPDAPDYLFPHRGPDGPRFSVGGRVCRRHRRDPLRYSRPAGRQATGTPPNPLTERKTGCFRTHRTLCTLCIPLRKKKRKAQEKGGKRPEGSTIRKKCPMCPNPGEPEMRTQPKTTPADALLSVGISPNVADANGEPANLVDAISQVANAIRYGAKWLGNGEADTPMGALEAHGKAIIDASETIAGAIRELADAIREARQ